MQTVICGNVLLHSDIDGFCVEMHDTGFLLMPILADCHCTYYFLPNYREHQVSPLVELTCYYAVIAMGHWQMQTVFSKMYIFTGKDKSLICVVCASSKRHLIGMSYWK